MACANPSLIWLAPHHHHPHPRARFAAQQHQKGGRRRPDLSLTHLVCCLGHTTHFSSAFTAVRLESRAMPSRPEEQPWPGTSWRGRRKSWSGCLRSGFSRNLALHVSTHLHTTRPDCIVSFGRRRRFRTIDQLSIRTRKGKEEGGINTLTTRPAPGRAQLAAAHGLSLCLQ